MEMIHCIAEETVFRNEENGYTVLTVKTGHERISAIGTMPMIAEGELLNISGEWVEHPVYGRQIKVHKLEIEKPTTIKGIQRYLSSGLIRGIGDHTAKQIVTFFGEEALDILSDHPERLMEIPGIGKKRAEMIAESYHEQTRMRDAMLFLQQYDIGPSLSIKIFDKYGENVQSILSKNPYRLVDEIEGIGFRTADRIAMSLGLDKDSPFRTAAGIRFLLNEAQNSSGHCFLPREELTKEARSLLAVSNEQINISLDEQILAHQVMAEIIPETETIAIYSLSAWTAEKQVSQLLVAMKEAKLRPVKRDPDAVMDEMEREEGIVFHPQQRKAVRTAIQNGVSLITGGPGTGKTTIIKAILKALAGMGEIALSAPTGRAAKRMSEACEMEAKTLHRLLEYAGDIGGFSRDKDYPLECKTLIIDEMSMVDIFLMNNLLKACQPGMRLILVGDADQLPSVGAGNVLKDLIESNAFPVSRLTEIFRQDEKSMIVYNAHQINRGLPPRLNAKGSDFYFERVTTPADAAKEIVSLCFARLPGFLKINPVKDIQVLSPTKKGECGVFVLNVMLQKVFNPPSVDKNEWIRGDTIFREGDKVMQTRNNYQLRWERETGLDYEEGQGIFNGDIGFIKAVNKEDKTLTVCFDDDRIAEYSSIDLEDLELAYCISVHKSQGSEFPVVVMPVVGGPPMLLTRNLFYTGVTRARKFVMLVGRESAVDQMIRNTHIRLRYSMLKDRIMALDKIKMG